jgi:hypothetical protein
MVALREIAKGQSAEIDDEYIPNHRLKIVEKLAFNKLLFFK